MFFYKCFTPFISLSFHPLVTEGNNKNSSTNFLQASEFEEYRIIPGERGYALGVLDHRFPLTSAKKMWIRRFDKAATLNHRSQIRGFDGLSNNFRVSRQSGILAKVYLFGQS